MGNLFAFIILSFLVVYIIYSPTFRSDNRLVTSALLLLLLRVFIAGWNGFIGPTLGADSDALQFYEEAIAIKDAGIFDFGSGVRFYSQILAYFMFIGESLFLACIVSVAAFVISSKHLLDICDYLQRDKYKIHILCAFGLLPSMFLFGSVTLREAFQILFLILSIKYFIVFYMDKRISFYFLGIFFSMLMGALHEGLLLCAIVLFPLVTVFNYNNTKSWLIYSRSKFYSYLFLGGVFLVGAAILPFVIGELDIIFSLMEGDLSRYATNYRTSLVGLESRSGYDVALDFSSFGQFVVSVSQAIFYYLFYPFPWKVAGAFDLYAFMEVVWRALLIFYSLKGIFVSTGNIKRLQILLLLIYFLVASVWASGTSNFGQGIRHNIVHYWIILLTGMPYLVLHMRSLVRKLNLN